jgi:hypothetical protein
MKVLVACEFTGVVRDAFIARGHDATSADLLPTEAPGPHYQGDARDLLDKDWDLLVAHPPCTYLAGSGVHLLWSDPDRWDRMVEAASLFRAFLDAPVPKIAVENPLMHGHAMREVGRRHTQMVQPWQFGEDASKRTCLWLRGLPRLQPTQYLVRRRYSNQTPSGQNKLGPSPQRASLRSRTYPGIAEAMADQWGREDTA